MNRIPSFLSTGMWTLAFAGLTVVGMQSCSSSSAPEASKEVEQTPASKISPAGRQSMDRRTDEVMRFQEMNKVEVENKISPYRYVISTERYSIFGQLVKASSHSRTIHGSGVTLLCPTNEAFNSFDNWKMMLRRGSQQELDDFVANHVLPITLTYEDLKKKDTHTNLAGETIEMNLRGGVSANGAHVRSGYIPTDRGNVIGLDGVVFVPFALR